METSGTLKFQPNVPVDVALQYESGKPVTSSLNNAQQVMYTLASGQKMYLDPEVAARVDELKLKRGEVFTMCKIGRGNATQWAIGRKDEVEREASWAADVYAPKPVEPPDHALSRKMHAASENAMRIALKAGVGAASEAQAYAKSIGFSVVFSPADIAQLAMIAARMQDGVR